MDVSGWGAMCKKKDSRKTGNPFDYEKNIYLIDLPDLHIGELAIDAIGSEVVDCVPY